MTRAARARLHHRAACVLSALVSCLLLSAPLTAQRDPGDDSPVWVDREGVLRCSGTREEVTAVGVNCCRVHEGMQFFTYPHDLDP